MPFLKKTPRPFLKILGLLAVLVAIAVGGRLWMMGGGGTPQGASRQTIGGPFTLLGSDGKTVTDQQFRGRYMLVYFGYTYCPDVCPTALNRTARALDQLPPETVKKIVPLFISVDPERDTPEKMGEYVKAFHPALVGLTGTPEQVKAAAGAYRVYYAKVEQPGSDADDYVMDHSALTYLMGPDGTLVTYFSHDTTAEAMARKLAELVK